MAMFEHLRQSLRDLLEGRVAPADRRALLAQMRDTLVQARVGLHDLREGVAATRRKLELERREHETVERRRRLAEGIGDTETVAIADRYVKLHAERLAVLERKLGAQEDELALAESEIESMTRDLKAASAGVGTMPPPGAAEQDPAGLEESETLRQEIDSLGRSQRREAADARADEMLEALKRRMGK